MWRVYRAYRRQGGPLLRIPGEQRREGQGDDARGPRQPGASASAAAGLHRRAGGAMRLLHQRHDHAGAGAARREPASDRGRDQGRARGEPLPLRNASAHRACREALRERREELDMTHATLPRRDFLKASGSLVVAFSFAPRLAEAAMAGGAASIPEAKPLAPGEVDSFLAIGADGTVTCYSGKVDLGTGVATALRQIVADELTVALDKVELITGDTLLTPDQGVTSGSFSIEKGGMQIRQACATARAALAREAARTGAPNLSFGELLRGKHFSLSVDPKAPLLDPSRYRYVGRPIPRDDIPGKVTGEFTYVQDLRRPGMLHARVVRPAAIGARLLSVDESSLSGIPDIVKVVRDGNFLAVVARSEWGAIKGARQLKAAWSDGAGLPDESKLWEHVRATKIVKDDVTSNVGRTEQVLPQARTRLSATYDFAIHTHGSIGPSCAVAEFSGGKLTSWSASQATHNLRKQLAAMFSLPEDNVRAIYVEGAGCYGRNGHEDAAADAALLARAMGKPVRVQWMRADEHGWDPKGPPTLIDLRAGFDATGKVVAWHSQFYVPTGAAGTVPL